MAPPPVPPVVTQAVRLAWETEARRAGLQPVASYWRWVARRDPERIARREQ